MGEFIRLNTRPCKYLLKNKLMVVHKNRLQKSAHLEQNDQAVVQLNASIKIARELIQDFLQSKHRLSEDFFGRSVRKHKIRLATEVIMLVIDFLKNLHNETLAITTIADKIASNIVTSTTLKSHTLDDILNIEVELGKVVSLKIYVPENMLEIRKKFQNLSCLFGASGLFIAGQGNNAKIELSSEEISFNLFFNEDDLDETLKNVCKLSHVDFE